MVNKLQVKLFNLSDKNFFIFLVCLTLIKNGFHPIGSEWISWVYESGKSFPTPINYLSYSLGPIYISRIFSFPPYVIWWSIFAVFTLFFYLCIYFVLKLQNKNNFKKYAVVFCVFPFFTSPLYFVGHYDLFTILAGVLAATTRCKYIIILSAFLAVSANPEQAVMTSLCICIFSLGSKKSMDKFIAKSWLFISASCYFLIVLIVGNSNNGDRFKSNLVLLRQVTLNSIGELNFIVFSVYGVGWLIILYGIRKIQNVVELTLITIGSIVIPVLCASLILDRTRVGIAVGTLPVILLLKYISSLIDVKQIPNRYFIYLVFAWMFIPQIFIDSDGSLRLPYAEFIRHFVV
jgi:hypothetical protein